MTVEEEDIPVHNRPRVRAWAASNMRSLPRPLLGSSERRGMLEDAQRFEKAAEALDEKTGPLRKVEEAELLREKAYQKRVLCAPIRSLPLETLSRILLLATPDSFAFQPVRHLDVAHPLSAVSRAWYEIIEDTPGFYSRIEIRTLPPSISYRLRELQDAARRLPLWLVKARNTGLSISFTCSDSFPPDTYSTGPLHEIWTTLLSLVGNWETFDYCGPVPFIHQFWEKANSAQCLRFVSLSVASSSQHLPRALSDALVSNTSQDSFSLPKLQHLSLSDFVLGGFILPEQMPLAKSLQALTLRGLAIACLSKDRLPRFASSLPFLARLRLEHVNVRSLGSLNPLKRLSDFKHLQHFELSQDRHDTVPLSILNGCLALTTLRLSFTAIGLDDSCRELSSVNTLVLELRGLSADPEKLMRLFTLLPSLKYLKVSPPPSTSPKVICDARGLLNELFALEDPIELVICPDLAVLILERATISSCELACFIADRTSYAKPADFRFLEDECKRLGRYVHWQGQDRNTRPAEWKPLCRLTTSDCPGIPDMVDAGLQALVDRCKSGELVLHDAPALGCDTDRDCERQCADLDCSCCQPRRLSERGEKYYGV